MRPDTGGRIDQTMTSHAIHHLKTLKNDQYWRIPVILSHEAILVLFLCVVTFCAYSNTLQSPFVFDDTGNIIENTHIRWDHLSLENVMKVATQSLSKNRPVANISFALNYYFDGYDVAGYRLVNVLIHIASGIFLFFVVKATLTLPSVPIGAHRSRLIPFFTSLIWLLHPLHTQSVTYIVQRMNSMAAMFYILALLLYIKGRLSAKKKWGITLFISSFLAGVMALGSKQIAATLPVMILFYEWCFFKNLERAWIRDNVVRFLVCFVVFSCVALFYLDMDPFERILGGYGRRDFTMTQRVLTEFRVVVFYLSLIFFPHPSRLSLDHYFPLSYSMIAPISTVFSCLLIMGSIAFSVYQAKKKPVFLFCTLWFFGNLLIESSIIGLEIIFEHRTYLPSMFVVLGLVLMIYKFAPSFWLRIPVLLGIAMICAVFTYERNGIWQNRVTLWQDCVDKAPEKARPHYNLGLSLQGYHPSGKDGPQHLTKTQITEKAIFHFREAIRLDPDHLKAHNNLGIALMEKGCVGEAISHYRLVLDRKPDSMEAAGNLAIALSKKGNIEEAIRYFKASLRSGHDQTKTLNNLGVLLARAGRVSEAALQFRKVIQIEPSNREARHNLQKLKAPGGMIDQAIDRLESSVEKMSDTSMLCELGNLYKEKGELQKAVKCYEKALCFRSDFSGALEKMALAMAMMGNYERSLSLYKKIVERHPDQAEIYYLIASVYSRQGNTAAAFSWLQMAVEKGFDGWQRIETDPNLENLRNIKLYKTLIERLR